MYGVSSERLLQQRVHDRFRRRSNGRRSVFKIQFFPASSELLIGRLIGGLVEFFLPVRFERKKQIKIRFFIVFQYSRNCLFVEHFVLNHVNLSWLALKNV